MKLEIDLYEDEEIEAFQGYLGLILELRAKRRAESIAAQRMALGQMQEEGSARLDAIGNANILSMQKMQEPEL